MQKFIISKEGELILGNVEFHFELLGKNYATGCWGGGFWRVDKESKTFNPCRKINRLRTS